MQTTLKPAPGTDPRGPVVTITAVEGPDGNKLTLSCGHIANYASHFHYQVGGVLRGGGVMTRKQQHAQAIEMLAQAAELLDQARGLLKSARTLDSVEMGGGVHRRTMRETPDTVEQLTTAARGTTCDDCGALIAECACAWANAEVA